MYMSMYSLYNISGMQPCFRLSHGPVFDCLQYVQIEGVGWEMKVPGMYKKSLHLLLTDILTVTQVVTHISNYSTVLVQE